MQTASVSSVSTYPTKSSDVAFGSLRIRTGDRGWPQECRLFGLSKAERECCASMSALGNRTNPPASQERAAREAGGGDGVTR